MRWAVALVVGLIVACASPPSPPTIKNYFTGDTIINHARSPGSHDPVLRSVVKIIHKKQRSIGAGFVFKNINGNSYVLSVQHLCVRRGQRLQVYTVPDEKNNTQEFFAKVVYTHKKDDICIARVYDTGKTFMPISFATDGPRSGDKVMTIGASVGMFPSKTEGYVVGHDLLGLDGADDGSPARKLLISAPSAAGNSGGPVYNESFEVVGILTARHPEFNHSTLCTHVEIIQEHLKKYFKRASK